jgi:3',5'-cyclic AMP phosphodiesterase CpdA
MYCTEHGNPELVKEMILGLICSLIGHPKPCPLYPGNIDIQNGNNVKLILGLIWSLIGHPKPCPLYPGNTDTQNGNVKLILGLIWFRLATLNLVPYIHETLISRMET